MKVDMSTPWVESQTKKPKFGEVLATIIEEQTEASAEQTELNNHLTEVDVNVTTRLNTFKENVQKEIDEHTSKKGPAHGETKDTIYLGKKENLPAASANDIKNGIYKKEWVTPRTASLIIQESLKVNTDVYMRSGMIPYSAGRLLGNVVTNQIFTNNSGTIPEIMTSGQVSYLLSTEGSYAMFAELGQGRKTNFSEGGSKAPIGLTHIEIKEGNIHTYEGQPVSLNNLTNSDEFVHKVTGLEWGFGEDKGNFYDSNFYPTFVVESEDVGSAVQEVEARLFDPTIVSKTDGTIYVRNLNTTKHNFNEMYVKQDGHYPFNNATYLSSDNFMSHIANTQLIQQNGVWGIIFDFLSGDVGISDWYPDSISRSTDKVLSKQAYYVVKQTTIESVSGFESAKAYTRLPGDLPWGFENRGTLDNSNFAEGSRYTSFFIPINDILKGFNDLSSDNQQKVINNIDTDLLVRVSTAWNNEYTKTAVLRIPFYYVVPNSEKSWSTYIDLQYTFSLGNDYNTASISAFNFNSSKRPTIGSNLDLTNTTDNRFYQWTTDISEQPFHPKCFKGCFLETGGHISAYLIGHRQYICHYKHDITSVRDWIVNDKYPVVNEEYDRVQDVAMMPGNNFYNDNTRIVPVNINNGVITYLTRARDKKGKYGYATFTVNDEKFDLLSTREEKSSLLTWLDKKTNNNIPLLINNANLRSPSININGLVFSELNGFIGYQNHGFNGLGLYPSGPTEIDQTLYNTILTNASIKNAYPIFFYCDQVLYWCIASRDGTKNNNGYDACVGGVRVDLYYDGTNYTIRALPNMKQNMVWGNLYEDFPVNLIRGRESESFDDVFIINKTGADNVSTVFVNYPDLNGRYYVFEIEADDAGYKYPKSFTPAILNLKKDSGYGTYSPYVFFGTYFCPFMMTTKFYYPNKDIFKFTKYTIVGQEVVHDYYTGWVNELPLYVMGENVTINGKSVLLDKAITLPLDTEHKGKIFINYISDVFNIYSTNNNPLGYPTEPDNSVMFAGYLENINGYNVLNFHAPRGYSDIVNQDFINSLLPIVDGKQMSTYAMGTTFPAILGKLSNVPRQYFFKK